MFRVFRLHVQTEFPFEAGQFVLEGPAFAVPAATGLFEIAQRVLDPVGLFGLFVHEAAEVVDLVLPEAAAQFVGEDFEIAGLDGLGGARVFIEHAELAFEPLVAGQEGFELGLEETFADLRRLLPRGLPGHDFGVRLFEFGLEFGKPCPVRLEGGVEGLDHGLGRPVRVDFAPHGSKTAGGFSDKTGASGPGLLGGTGIGLAGQRAF